MFTADVTRELEAIVSGGRVSKTQVEDALVHVVFALPPDALDKLPAEAHRMVERFVERAGISGTTPAEALASVDAYFRKHPVEPQLASRLMRAFAELTLANTDVDHARRVKKFLGG